MAQVVEKKLLFRANAAILRTAVVGGMVIFALGAALYDVGTWLHAW